MKLSVIIPVYNGGADFVQCLKALKASTRLADEIIVIDDGSSDSSPSRAKEFTDQVHIQAGGPYGPAAARNCGAELASGDLLIFIDADVAVHADTLMKIEACFQANPDVAALFGSYDNHPPKPGFVSHYKNLQHHYVHQNGKREASTFWAGCGSIRRAVFIDVHGFNQNYHKPSIEDIELGVRLRSAGYRIWLCPDIQVAHLKRWNLASLLRADILNRAIPWSRLIVSSNQMPTDLNLDTKSRVSSLSAWLIVLCLIAGFWFHWIWLGGVVLLTLLLALNYAFYHFLQKQEGVIFVIGGIVLHLLYYLYSSFTFGIIYILHQLQRMGNPNHSTIQT